MVGLRQAEALGLLAVEVELLRVVALLQLPVEALGWLAPQPGLVRHLWVLVAPGPQVVALGSPGPVPDQLPVVLA